MAHVQTITGVDRLVRDGCASLRGLRIGLITNHTGLTQDGLSTIDVLHQTPGVHLGALFAPEHGIRGALDEKVADSTDARTGLPIYSLYGEKRRPQPEHLRELDALVFDIHDIGCRFFTYISTLGNAMEEAVKHGLRFFVLDRPNPITGTVVEGPMADLDRLSFTAWHPLPVRHGMTVGELARQFNAERRMGVELTVLPCEGWRRADWWDATGLTWVNPSPNMRNLTQATLYPGIGLMEFTNISVGRGTDTPFEIIGAPWMDERKLAAYLNGRDLPGIRFIPVRFSPRASVHAGAECGGVSFLITNRDRFRCLRTGLEVAAALRRLFPDDWKADNYDRLLVNRRVYQAFLDGAPAETLETLWKRDRERFLLLRRQYLLYG